MPISFVMSAKPTTRPDPTLKARAAAVPWWAWVGAAILSHLVLRLAADLPAGEVLQYLVPALLIVAGVFALRQRHAGGRAQGRAPGADFDVASMRWREFETLIARAFEVQGYHVNDAGAAGSDVGTDLLMRKERETFLVHCKPWRADKVEIETVRAVQAAMRSRGALGGFILSSGRFSREATVVASGVNIRLVDGPALHALLHQGRAHVARRGPAPAPAPVAPAETERAPAPQPHAVLPAELALPCPLCGADMKKRLAKRGVNAGQYFWGCTRHPDCKGTRRVRPG